MKKLLFKNFGLKILAVLSSIVLWVFATHRGLSVMTFDVPLEFKNIPKKLVLISNTVKVVTLNIKGQERLVRNMRPSDISVYVDLSEAKKGENIYPLSRDNVKTPRWVTVTHIAPSSVKVELEKLVTKIVRVRPVIVGAPEKGFYVKSIDVVPQTLVVEGKSSDVKKVNTIETECLDITGLKESFTQDAGLDIKMQNIRTSVEYVKVKVIIAMRGK